MAAMPSPRPEGGNRYPRQRSVTVASDAPYDRIRDQREAGELCGAGPGPEARDKRIGLERDADRVLGKGRGLHIGLAVANIRKIVDQQLDLIVVRVAIVHRGRRPVVDAPIGANAALLEPRIGVEQLFKALEGKGHMVQPGLLARAKIAAVELARLAR